MFESVLHQTLPPRQMARGAVVAIGVHALALLATVYLSSSPVHAVEKEMRALALFSPPSTFTHVDLANQAGGSSSPNPHGGPKRYRAVPVDTDKLKKRTDTTSSAAPNAEESGSTTSAPSDVVGTPGETSGSGTGGVGRGGTSQGIIAIPFGEGMKRPVPTFQPAPVYTREALAAKSEGTVSLRCIITVEGTLTGCRIIKGVPYMDNAVLEALSRWRYSPAMFQGRHVSVYYPINLRLLAP